ncbi:Uncharacterised protein [Streptococcus dysgalactiae]|nr:Uncharacterised protein [Streptococcus dysgalactiae]
MSKLSPKPTDKNPKKSWKDLDSTLQAAFKNTDKRYGTYHTCGYLRNVC